MERLKRGGGRPRLSEPRRPVTFRLTATEISDLHDLARDLGSTIPEFLAQTVRRLLREDRLP